MTSFDSDKAAELHRHLHSHLPSDPALRVKALESLAVERGLVAPETIDAWVEAGVDHVVIQPMPPMEGTRFFGEKIIHHYA